MKIHGYTTLHPTGSCGGNPASSKILPAAAVEPRRHAARLIHRHLTGLGTATGPAPTGEGRTRGWAGGEGDRGSLREVGRAGAAAVDAGRAAGHRAGAGLVDRERH